MNHVAIDLGGRESQVCIRDASGSIIDETRVPTKRLPKLAGKWERSRVVLETSAEAFAIADAVLACGHEVRVVPGTLVKTLGVGSRGVKTDQRDARVLSEVSCRIDLPSVHIPSALSRELKSVCGGREVLIAMRTKLINNVRGWLRTQLIRIRTGATRSFPLRVREHSLVCGVPLPPHIERQLAVLDSINLQVKGADDQVLRIAREHSVCQRLMTVPGVGPVTAVRFVAALDDVTRFPNAHAVQSYLGLTPGEHSSSDRQQKTGITKAGPAELRRTLIQAAWAVLTRCPRDPMATWANQVAARRGRFISVVALARKLAGVLFALWRDGTTYRASRATQPAAP